MVKVINVKWGGKSFDGLEVNDSQTVLAFKQQIQRLTDVPVHKQKILGFAGGVLRDDDKLLSDVGLREGMRVMLVGVPEASGATTAASTAAPVVPAERPIFLEDLSPNEKARLGGVILGASHPAGIVNLGNTCYMNAVLQLLGKADKAVEELTAMEVSAGGPNDADDRFVLALQKFFFDWRKEVGNSVTPYNLVTAVRMRWPQFATQTRSGEGFAQQDAEEFLSAMLQSLCERSEKFEKLFGFDTEEKLVCKEGGECSVRTERNRILSCFTTGVKPVDHMMQGIQLALNEEVEKHSESLGKNAIFYRSTRVNSLPEYLLVKFVRFEWKAANSFSRTESSKTKVCRRIQYPTEFDVYELASDSLKKQLEIPRYAWTICTDPTRVQAAAMKDEGEDDKHKADGGDDDDGEEGAVTTLSSGVYELVASVSHKGRSADSGHYVGWAQKDQDKETWYKFDDDRVSEIRIKDVDMCGGRSDFHISVVLLYRRRDFDASAVDVAKAVAEAEAARSGGSGVSA